MKKIRCIAIDDEPMALLVIEQFCQRKGDMEITLFSEPKAGLESVRKTIPDIVFLDVQMNGISGLQIANLLPEQCCLIFTTAYAKYAIDGFELEAVDFLHKPFSYERFCKAVDKAIKYGETFSPKNSGSITLKQEYNNVVIAVDDIIFLEAMENYTKVHCCNGKCILTRTSLKKVQEMLPAVQFVRVHKSYVVSLLRVTGFTHTGLSLEGWKREVPIGRVYLDNFMDVMKKRR